MRLLSLYIKEYKNIQDQTFDFSDNTGYITLIGLNGSGKSNLLEAISLIFDDLYDISHSEQVKGYRITYELGDQEYTYTTLDEQNNIIPLAKEDRICPSSVIACYSGEDLRLWNMAYMPYYMGFFYSALHGKDYVPRTMYINKYCWKMALISLLFSLNREVQQFVQDILKIDVKNVTVQFAYNNITNPQQHDAYNWLERIKQQYGTSDIPFEELRDFGLGNTQHTDLTEDKLVFFYLYFLFMPLKSSRQPVDKLITNINIKLGTFEFDSLSEGEKKMLLIACITQILGDEDSLVLLDEPDAHTHVAMKKELLKSITQFQGQTIMTTHSPMFLNKRWEGYNEDNVFYMHEGRIENTKPLKYLSELTDNEVDYFEGSFILSSKKILVVEGKYDDKYLKKAIDVFAKIDEKYHKLDDIAIFSANSASAAEVIYNQILSPCISQIEKVVFLFDYDDAGWKSGWKKIDAIREKDPKVLPIFYQNNYSSASYPTSDNDVKKANGSKCEIKNANSFMVEDLFSENSYNSVTNIVLRSKTHKDFRNIKFEEGKSTAEAIKKYIEKNYLSFIDEWYDGFKPVLDMLLKMFNFE